MKTDSVSEKVAPLDQDSPLSYFIISPHDPKLSDYLDGQVVDGQGRACVLVEFQDASVKVNETGWMFRWIETEDQPRIWLKWMKSIRMELWGFVLGPIAAALSMLTQLDEIRSNDSLLNEISARTGLTLIGAIFLQTAVHWLGDESDYRRGWDRVALRGGARVLSRGWLTARKLRTAGWIALSAAALVGVHLVMTSQAWIPLVAITVGVATLEFLNRFFGLKYRGYAEVAAWFFYGPLLTLGAALAVVGKANWTTVLVGLGSGSAALLSIHLKGMARMLEDARAGHRTWPVRAGFDASKTFAILCFVAMIFPLAILSVFQPPGGSWVLMVLSVPVLLRGATLLDRVWKLKSPASGERFKLYRASLALAWVYFLALTVGGQL